MSFTISIGGFGNIECVLTPAGEANIKWYLANLKAKRKEILDAGRDTAEDTNLPTMEDIISDIETFYAKNDLPDYCNNWRVTDDYYSDYPLCLRLRHDIITEDAAKSMGYTDHWPESEEEEREHRIRFITCNIDEDTFPDDPAEFLREFPDDYNDEDSEKHPGKCVIIWEPFEDASAERLADFIETGDWY